MKSIIYVTTPTSGSQSIWRILTALLPNYKHADITPSTKLSDLASENHIYLARGIKQLEGGLASKDFRYIGNFRDPRDMLCNQYYWLVQHPATNQDAETAAKTLEHRKKRFDGGIDSSVLRVKNDSVFTSVFEIQRHAEQYPNDVLFISYAQLCCAFDLMVSRLAAFLETPVEGRAKQLVELERTDNLASNPKWIGNQWFGTDIMPGRFRTELKPETIAALNHRFSEALDRLKSLEVPELRHLYD